MLLPSLFQQNNINECLKINIFSWRGGQNRQHRYYDCLLSVFCQQLWAKSYLFSYSRSLLTTTSELVSREDFCGGRVAPLSFPSSATVCFFVLLWVRMTDSSVSCPITIDARLLAQCLFSPSIYFVYGFVLHLHQKVLFTCSLLCVLRFFSASSQLWDVSASLSEFLFELPSRAFIKEKLSL